MNARNEDYQLFQSTRQGDQDFTTQDPWRVLRIQGEFVEGFDALSKVDSCVAVFGSARMGEDDPYYQKAITMGAAFADHGVGVITGGGPGVMEGVNKGAYEKGGLSIGCNIELPFEQCPNPYQNISLTFRYFFVRKLMFVKYSIAYVIFPGGFGTLDELFESLTLAQTGKIEHFPVVLFGSEYWEGLLDWLNKVLVARGYVAAEDMELFKIFDDPEEAAQWVADMIKKKERPA